MSQLREAIAAYRRALPGEVRCFDIRPLDRIGMPVYVACNRLPDGWQIDSFGYGETDDEALTGALGELAEETFGELYLRRVQTEHGSYVRMVARHGEDRVVDPLTLCLPAGSRYDATASVAWVAAQRLATGETVWVPLESVAASFAQMRGCPALFTPITNGRGAGLTRERAIAHGLLELLQRDGNCVSFRALDQGIVIEPSSLSPRVQQLQRQLAAMGLNATLKLASTGFGLANVYAVGDDLLEPRLPLMLTACGEAVNADTSGACRKALLEYAAARARKAFMHGPLDAVEAIAPAGYSPHVQAVDPAREEPRALAAMAQWCAMSADELRSVVAPVFVERGRVDARHLPVARSTDIETQQRSIAARLTDAGLDVLVVDYAPPDSGVHVVRTIVTGLECETMSYHRIGERGARRLLDRGDSFVGQGAMPRQAKPVRLTADAEERLGGPVWFDPVQADRIVGRLYPLYREPGYHSVAIGLARASALA